MMRVADGARRSSQRAGCKCKYGTGYNNEGSSWPTRGGLYERRTERVRCRRGEINKEGVSGDGEVRCESRPLSRSEDDAE